MLRAIRVVVGAAVVVFGGMLLAQPKESAAEGYFPLKVKAKWTYKLGDNDVTMTIVKVDVVNKEDQYQVDTFAGKEAKPGEAKLSEWFVVRADGVYRTRIKDDKLDPPVKVLPLPIKKDTAWDVNSKLGTQVIKGSFRVKSEKEKVKIKPAGATSEVEYDAVLVEGENMDIAGTKTTVRVWFAKDRWIIKEEVSVVGGDKVTLELLKFEDAK
jgi:hypothetical protein